MPHVEYQSFNFRVKHHDTPVAARILVPPIRLSSCYYGLNFYFLTNSEDESISHNQSCIIHRIYR